MESDTDNLLLKKKHLFLTDDHRVIDDDDGSDDGCDLSCAFCYLVPRGKLSTRDDAGCITYRPIPTS